MRFAGLADKRMKAGWFERQSKPLPWTEARFNTLLADDDDLLDCVHVQRALEIKMKRREIWIVVG